MPAYRILFVMDPIERVLPDKDTTFVFMLESQSRGHAVYYCNVNDLFVEGSAARARVRRVLVSRGTPHYQLLEERTETLSWFDAVFMRKDPPVDLAYIHATQILSLAVAAGVLVLNDPRGLRDANEKLYALNFPTVIPPTIVTCEIERLKQFLDEQGGEMIIKPLDACGGAGVFHLRRADRNLNALLDLSTDSGRRMIMGQQYIPAIRQGDKRVIVLDGRALGATLRVPREDEHRGNIHVGGTCVPTVVSPRDRFIVDAVAPKLRRDGLYFVGLDIIGDYLTEVNVTSPTGVQEINALSNPPAPLEASVLDYLEADLLTRRGPTGA